MSRESDLDAAKRTIREWLASADRLEQEAFIMRRAAESYQADVDARESLNNPKDANA